MNGPDQILPATCIKTSEPDGAVRLVLKPTGPCARKPVSVYTMFKKAYENFPNNPALMVKREDVWKQWTFKEYFEESNIVAKAFIKLGLDRFHGVCIIGYNSPEWVISAYGCIFAGGLTAGVYTTNSPDACQTVAENCRAQIIVVEDDIILKKILSIKRFLPELKAIVQWSGEPGAPGVISWAELLAIGMYESDEELNRRLSLTAINQCCCLIYTSGTTGPPKGVMLSQDHVTWGANFYQEFFDVPDGEASLVSFLPLSHLAAQMGDMYCMVKLAGVVYFSQPDALKGSLVKTLNEVQPYAFYSVPRVWEKMYDKMQEIAAQSGFFKKSIGAWAKYQSLNYYNALKEGRELSALEKAKYASAKTLILNKVKTALGFLNSSYIGSGSAPIDPEILEYFMSLDMPIMEIYGLSESLSIGSISKCVQGGFKFGTVGKVPPHTEVMLLGIGQHRAGEGEICMRGRNICMGYLRMPDKTDETVDDDGWLHTGDLGRFDSEGFLYISGRLKEIIITAGGENIPPILIEEAVKRELPCLSTAMLIGDKRKYLTILLALKAEVDTDTMMPLQELTPLCIKWLKSNGSKSSTVAEVINEVKENPKGKIARAFQEGIDRYNNNHSISKAQRIQNWTILAHDFSLPTEELNNTLKIKRSFVVEKYADVIDEMYSENQTSAIQSKL